MKKRYIVLIAIGALLFLILAILGVAGILGFLEALNASNPLTPDAVEGDAVLYTSDDLELEIVVVDLEDTADIDGVRGTTKDGNSFTAKGDDVYVKVGSSTVKAKVISNNAGKDPGKIAGVVSALASKQTGYKKGVDDYNHNYSVYYIEPAECLFYYPSQLTILEKFEDNSLLFKDTRSEASLRVKLEKNPYSSMDELEGFIKNSEYSLVLAMGNDWYTAEKGGNGRKTFTYAGLGESYIVNADLSYADGDSFVFEELRRLIKCRFIGKGIWVSEALSPDYKSDVLKDKYKEVQPGSFGMTSYYSPADRCYLYYPDVFTVVTSGTNDGTYFADPATGAYILLYTYYDDSETSLRELIEQSPYEKANIDGEYSVRFSDKKYYGYENFERVIAYRDGMRYYADFYYPREYEKIYGPMAGLFSIVLPGEDGGNTEMRTIYYPAYGCTVTIPAQFSERALLSDTVAFEDEMTGLEMTLTFAEFADRSESNNLFSYFDCRAPDENIVLGEDLLKWHDKDGLRIGAVGERYGALLFLPYPNAYKAYQDSFDRFDIRFISGETLRGEADEIRENAEITDRGDIISPDTTPTKTPAKAPTTKPEPVVSKEKASYEDSLIDEIWELGEPSDEFGKIFGDINILIFENLTEEVADALDNLLDTLISLDFRLTDSYEEEEYNLYQYDIEGFLPDTGEFVYMTLDMQRMGYGDWRIALCYVFRKPVGEVKNGGLLWDEDDRPSGLFGDFTNWKQVGYGMKEIKEHLAESGKDPDAYVYRFGMTQLRLSQFTEEYDEDRDIYLPYFSYGSYRNGIYVPEQTFVYDYVEGFLYEEGKDGNMNMVWY